jgi:hypothetical protein
VAGTTLIASSAFVDPAPPPGWKQCAGFANTTGDDVTDRFLDNCLGADQLRVRVFDPTNALEDDMYQTGLALSSTWTTGVQSGTWTLLMATHWTYGYCVNLDGRSSCGTIIAANTQTFHTCKCGDAVIAGGATGADEYRLGDSGGANLPDRHIALYR